ncbi:MAG: hypothetical protein IBX63_11055, partial [Coriobacteriia bacterium]|nr:hypothetical protein [Coriobacteriia bacterium]
ATNRLQEKLRGGNVDTLYQFDSLGRRSNQGPAVLPTQITYTWDEDNRLIAYRDLGTADVEATYTYDAAGQRTASSIRKGTEQVDSTYVYDGITLLTAAIVKRVSGTVVTDCTITYLYDEAGRAYAALYDATGQRTASSIRKGTEQVDSTYVYDGITLLTAAIVKRVSGTVVTDCTITYLYDESGRAYAALYKGTGAPAPQLFHLTTTDRGDVVQVLDAATAPVATYGYDAWGNPVAARTTVSATASDAAKRFAELAPLRYAGYCYDSGTGLYYLSQRYYDPATYQFISKDPVKADGEESAYQYCGGDPVGKVDPTGMWSITVTRVLSIAQMWRQWEKVKMVLFSAALYVLFPPSAAASGSATAGSVLARRIANGLANAFVWGPLKEWFFHRHSNAIKRWGNPRAVLTAKFVSGGGHAALYGKVEAIANKTPLSARYSRIVYWRGYVWQNGRRYAARWA